MAASKGPNAETEDGEVLRNSEDVTQVPVQGAGDSRKRDLLTMGSLPMKKARTFESGSSSRPPVKKILKPSYQSTQETQLPGYVGYHPTNYGSKDPVVPDTAESQAALKRISMYNMETLVQEFAQNISNLDHLFKGGLAPLASLRDHYQILDELAILKRDLKAAELKVKDYAGTNTWLHTHNKILARDVASKDSDIKELEKKNRTMQTEHAAALAEKISSDKEASIQKTLSESLEISLQAADQTVLQLRDEVKNLKDNQTSAADLLIKNSELTEELSLLQKDYEENDDLLRETLQQNIDDFNNLVVIGPHLHPRFDVGDVLTWVATHPEEAERIRLGLAEPTAEGHPPLEVEPVAVVPLLLPEASSTVTVPTEAELESLTTFLDAVDGEPVKADAVISEKDALPVP